jgi:hypothetical protein
VGAIECDPKHPWTVGVIGQARSSKDLDQIAAPAASGGLGKVPGTCGHCGGRTFLERERGIAARRRRESDLGE